jgi:thymidylate synthase
MSTIIDRGSFEGNKRREFDLVMVHIKYPGTVPLIPDIPAELGVPAPPPWITSRSTSSIS